ncbi:sulfur carrier protein ThiS [Nocardioides pocheonensis]|uniref:Sulfur carrier protein ThiS n=1 Tax=Nocardioides pocheonensis TaxID=661485 RepID=A0A3N0GI42_9ACTN|nr:sulfur carrier protein ThiS [Nocardioides pocheonensis]RNM12153.1 sulfur carrier protein ThiS [Nocardioides pocheonensis]
MTIVLNGSTHAGAATVADLIEVHLGARAPRGVAVAVDGEVVPRDRWPRTQLDEGAVVEVVTAVQGG